MVSKKPYFAYDRKTSDNNPSYSLKGFQGVRMKSSLLINWNLRFLTDSTFVLLTDLLLYKESFAILEEMKGGYS